MKSMYFLATLALCSAPVLATQHIGIRPIGVEVYPETYSQHSHPAISGISFSAPAGEPVEVCAPVQGPEGWEIACVEYVGNGAGRFNLVLFNFPTQAAVYGASHAYGLVTGNHSQSFQRFVAADPEYVLEPWGLSSDRGGLFPSVGMTAVSMDRLDLHEADVELCFGKKCKR